jgi:hypothetical protein
MQPLSYWAVYGSHRGNLARQGLAQFIYLIQALTSPRLNIALLGQFKTPGKYNLNVQM